MRTRTKDYLKTGKYYKGERYFKVRTKKVKNE